MPEYLSPGVYVEETSYRAKSIQGVATSTAGFVGQCRYGPARGTPVLITSNEEFRRRFGGPERLNLEDGTGGAVQRLNHLALAVQAFFENGGRRVYISRVFEPRPTSDGRAQLRVGASGLTLAARHPGSAGNVSVEILAHRSTNVVRGTGAARFVRGLRDGDAVELHDQVGGLPRVVSAASPIDPADVRMVAAQSDGSFLFTDMAGGGGETLQTLLSGTVTSIQRLSVSVNVRHSSRENTYRDVSFARASERFLGDLGADGSDASVAVQVVVPATAAAYVTELSDFLQALPLAPTPLRGGNDGAEVDATSFAGAGEGENATGLVALEQIDDVAVVAAPGASALPLATDQQAVRDLLIGHCERLRYRMAILSADQGADTAEIRRVRGQHDSTYAALYYPWVVVRNPLDERGPTLTLPPEGFIAGIYARSDNERGVHKAPANEIVRGALRFSRRVTTGTQDVLNPEGINVLRHLDGRGYRVWGARTISSDPEWIYVNVRRLFLFLKRSIDVSTQWVVFEPNNEETWLKVRMTVEAFLLEVWRTGALLGEKPEDAFFVRCDRSTMTLNDLDNGRLICLIGVAPTKPAEFVIFRIGQWTAEAEILPRGLR